MLIDLVGDLRIDFLMVRQKLSATDRAELDQRCCRVFEMPCDGSNAVALLNYDPYGIPTRCSIQINPTVRTLQLDRRLAIIAHEIGHVLTGLEGMTEFEGERLADLFAQAIGFPHRTQKRSPPDFMLIRGIQIIG